MRLSPSHMASVAWGSIKRSGFLQRRGVSDVELYRSRGESAGEITYGAIRRSKPCGAREA